MIFWKLKLERSSSSSSFEFLNNSKLDREEQGRRASLMTYSLNLKNSRYPTPKIQRGYTCVVQTGIFGDVERLQGQCQDLINRGLAGRRYHPEQPTP